MLTIISDQELKIAGRYQAGVIIFNEDNDAVLKVAGKTSDCVKDEIIAYLKMKRIRLVETDLGGPHSYLRAELEKVGIETSLLPL